jgi:AcrR family transcriptional regulator
MNYLQAPGQTHTKGGSRPPTLGAADRLLDAIGEVAARDGYSNLTVETVLAAARVSRSTFYQNFSSVDDCFTSAYRRHGQQLMSEIVQTARRGGPPKLATLDALVDTALRRPHVARVLMIECLSAGPVGIAEREALISAISELVGSAPVHGALIDLPAGVLVGGTFRFLAMRLADGTVEEGLRDEVHEWAQTFARQLRTERWSSRFQPAVLREASQAIPFNVSRVRPRTPARERILRATAATVAAKGYRATTVADIVSTAGMSRRLFYNHYGGKAEAFTATYEHVFQQTIAACAPAFFSSSAWPERVWQSALAFTGFVAREPAFAHLGFVECYALGPSFVERAHDTQLAFTLFLEEGYRQRREAQLLPRSCSALTAAAIMELGYQASRRWALPHIRSLQPLAVYIALTTFIGAEAAGAFVTGKLSVSATA